MMTLFRSIAVPALLGVLAMPAPAAAQGNIHLPVDAIIAHLRVPLPNIIDWRGSRAEGDRTQRAVFALPDSTVLVAKWASAPYGGSDFNNEPRYEQAAFVLQRLFLDEHEYVVPPSIIRSFPLQYVRQRAPQAQPTFDNTSSVVVFLQYWLQAVTPDNVWDSRRAENDTAYARHVGNLNTLTHLINHSDNNVGNILISALTEPRLFSVDNGVAFRSPPSNRGNQWRAMRVRRLPATTVDRLRAITREDLDTALGVLVEFEVRDGQLVEVEPGENLAAGRGVRRSGGRIQFGLTSAEINDVETRLRNLLRDVDRGQIRTF